MRTPTTLRRPAGPGSPGGASRGLGRWVSAIVLAAAAIAVPPLSAASGTSGNLHSQAVSDAVPAVTTAGFGTPVAYGSTSGDTWYTTEDAGGKLFATTDDTNGANGACGSAGANITISRITGDNPAALTVSNVNCMRDWGTWGDNQGDGDTKGSWKTSGIFALGTTLYLFVNRDQHPHDDVVLQNAYKSCLLKSTDGGLTWTGPSSWSSATPIQKSCYTTPTFPARFGAPAFIQYGPGGAGGADGSDQYVYAMSNDGWWDNGNSIILGRVPRSAISNLRSSDWQYYAGSGSWTSDLNHAQPVITASRQLSSTGVTYDAPLHTYIMTEWNYPQGPSNYHPSEFNFYASPTPWGPWKQISRTPMPDQGWYNPVLVNKFLSADGTSGVLFTAAAGAASGPASYRLNVMPVTFSTRASQSGSLAAASNNTGIAPDTRPSAANIDSSGYGYSAQALSAAGINAGQPVSTGGITYTWPNPGAPGLPDNTVPAGQKITLNAPAGTRQLGFLGAATWGNTQGNVTLNYSDGTSTSQVLGLTDWTASQASYKNQVVATMSYRNCANCTGGRSNTANHIYAATLPVDPGKVLTSVTLPTSGGTGRSQQHIFAIGTSTTAPTGLAITSVNTPR